MFNYLDLTVEYYDANGKVQSEPMTQKIWTKNVKAKLSATPTKALIIVRD